MRGRFLEKSTGGVLRGKRGWREERTEPRDEGLQKSCTPEVCEKFAKEYGTFLAHLRCAMFLVGVTRGSFVPLSTPGYIL